MDEQNRVGSRFEAELWRDGKLVIDKPKHHNFLIVKKNEVIKIDLKRSRDEK